eukprot:GILI01008104.1.p2 GENE.GILI01008104.1~~GILI01008104.1.p2  ORF type:complete len:127 (-),score=35.37 GILI01008104.1:121-501(-)
MKLSLFVFASIVIAASAFSLPVIHFEEQGGEKTVNAKLGDSFAISLVGTPTTGHSWKLTDRGDRSVLAQVGRRQYVTDEENDFVGGTGTFQFQFKAASKGTTTLKFTYLASWGEHTHEAVVHVKVD